MIDVDSLTGTYGGFADDARPQRRRVEFAIAERRDQR